MSVVSSEFEAAAALLVPMAILVYRWVAAGRCALIGCFSHLGR